MIKNTIEHILINSENEKNSKIKKKKSKSINKENLKREKIIKR